MHYDWCSYKKGKFGLRRLSTGRTLCELVAVGVTYLQPRNAKNY